jgi:hypothetical protein
MMFNFNWFDINILSLNTVTVTLCISIHIFNVSKRITYQSLKLNYVTRYAGQWGLERRQEGFL